MPAVIASALPGVPEGLCGLDPDVDAETACALFGITLEDLLHELEFRQRRKMAKIEQEMALAAKRGGETRILRTKEGDGYVDIQVHPASYIYWTQRLGRQCWEDKGFVREYKRDNPASRVKAVSDRITIVRPELGAAPASAPAAAPTRPGVHGKRGRWAA